MTELYTGHEVEGCEICNTSFDNCKCIIESNNGKISEADKLLLWGEKDCKDNH